MEENNPIYKLTQSERETIISIADDEKEWNAHTNIPKDARRFEKQGWKKINEEFYPDGSMMSATYSAPRKAISIGKAERPKRVLTEEQRKALSERMKNIAKKEE